MNGLLCSFHDNLYNLPSCLTVISSELHTSRIADFVAKTALSTIPAEMVQDLERPFTEEVLSSLKNNKSPGPDGYSARFYKKFQDLLTPFMTIMFNTVSTDSPFPTQALEAHITVLSNPGRTILSAVVTVLAP